MTSWHELETTVPTDHVAFFTQGQKVTLKLGPKPVMVSNGYGGWETIKRPREDALVEWTGHEPKKMLIEVLFDGLLLEAPWGKDTEHAIAVLEAMTRKVDGANSPAAVWIMGKALPINDEREWVINDIQWQGDDIRRPTDGKRVRATAIIEILEYINFDLIEGRHSSAKKRRNKGKRRPVPTKQKKGTYIVKEGDTLRKIAKRELGSASRWHEIANINHIRDGHAIRSGQHLKIP